MGSIPAELMRFLEPRFGTVTGEQFLSGVAGDGAKRLAFADGKSAIVKSSTSSWERNFYEKSAQVVRRLNVGIPELYWSGSDERGRQWILIEDIPNAFPRERWVGDEQQIATLLRLHVGTWKDKRLTLDADSYKPSWDDEMSAGTSAWFPAGYQRDRVAEQLAMIQREAQVLFQPICSISADPNPTNWRVRKDGELVLIDWERFTYGHPAIDLAITMPGLGSPDGLMERGLARVYLSGWKQDIGQEAAELSHLERLIRVAKLWTIVEFVARVKLHPTRSQEETTAHIVHELPRVMDELLRDAIS
ncbi:phosphotransferase [Alicyclobacillus curvatus]|nr:phosphotransferase [Alicyclobacillus curvatus]